MKKMCGKFHMGLLEISYFKLRWSWHAFKIYEAEGEEYFSQVNFNISWKQSSFSYEGEQSIIDVVDNSGRVTKGQTCSAKVYLNSSSPCN